MRPSNYSRPTHYTSTSGISCTNPAKKEKTMTKKDYELIAGVFNTQFIRNDSLNDLHSPKWREKENTIAMSMIDMAVALEQDNKRFNADTFFNACRKDTKTH